MQFIYKSSIVFLSICLSLSCNDERNVTFKKRSTSIKNEQADKSLPNRHFGKSEITNPGFDSHLLFGTWADKTDASVCNLEINEKRLLLCDYDGEGERLYRIIYDSIFLDNPTLIFKGKIIKVSADSLIIHWQNNSGPEKLVRWK